MSAPVQRSYNIEVPSTTRTIHSGLIQQPLSNLYPSVNDPLLAYDQPGAPSQIGYTDAESPLNYFESPRQIDYAQNTIVETNYLAPQSMSRDRIPMQA